MTRHQTDRVKRFDFRKDIEPFMWMAAGHTGMILHDQQIAGEDDPLCGQMQECVAVGVPAAKGDEFSSAFGPFEFQCDP